MIYIQYVGINDNVQSKQQFNNDTNQLSIKYNSKFDDNLQEIENTIDKEWQVQVNRYNFTCIHGLMSKNYEPLIINKPQNKKYQFINTELIKTGHSQKIQEDLLGKKEWQTYKVNHKSDSIYYKKEQVFNQSHKFQSNINHEFENEEIDEAIQKHPIKISLDYSNFQVNQTNKDKLTHIQQILMPQMINTIRSIIFLKNDQQSQQLSKIIDNLEKNNQSSTDISKQQNEIQFSNLQNKNIQNIYEEQIKNNNKQSYSDLAYSLKQSSLNKIKKQLKHTNAEENHPLKKKIIIPNSQCFQTTVPESHSTVGIDSDLILYITNTKKQQNALIWGVVCVRDFKENMRPVAAQLNINDDLLNIDNDVYNVKSLIHEIVHILGFSRKSLELTTKSQNFIRKSETDPKKQILAIDILNDFAQKYYNCTENKQFQGVEIEDEEDDPDQLSMHFEKRYLMNDVMTSDISVNSILSPFTLNVLQSTGWYDIDFNISATYQYFFNSGCEILKNFTEYYNNQTQNQQKVSKNSTNMTNLNSITNEDLSTQQSGHQKQLRKTLKHEKDQKQYMKSYNIFLNQTGSEIKQFKLNSYDNGVQNYCNQTEFNQTLRGCSYDLTYKSTCHSSKYSNGYSYLQPLENGSCLDSLNNIHSQYSNITGEIFSNTSFCFISNLFRNSSYTNINIDSTRCYQAECDQQSNQIHIQLFNQTIVCTKYNQIIENPFGLFGQFNCPHIQNFCQTYKLRKQTQQINQN